MNDFRAFPLQLLADSDSGSNMGVSQNPTGSKGVDVSAIRYGREEAPVQNPTAQQEAQPDPDGEFAELIKGKYKDQYNRLVKESVDRRFKSKQALLDRAAAQEPIIHRLASRYGKDAGDIDAIVQAFDDDNALWEKAAQDSHMDVESYKTFKKMEAENTDLKRQAQQRQLREGADRIYAQWLRDAEELQQLYPGFDFQTELGNETFAGILRSGAVDMKTAYEAAHLGELVPSAMEFAAKTVEQNVAKSVASNRSRPRENGISSQGAALHKSDPAKLTFKDIDEINRRVARGERITF